MDMNYDKKGELSRVFHSFSYSCGFMGGVVVNAFNAATGKERFWANDTNTEPNFWTNSALGTITGFVNMAGITLFSHPMYILGIAGFISDAFGGATGESFGAMKEGYKRQRAANLPKAVL